MYRFSVPRLRSLQRYLKGSFVYKEYFYEVLGNDYGLFPKYFCEWYLWFVVLTFDYISNEFRQGIPFPSLLLMRTSSTSDDWQIESSSYDNHLTTSDKLHQRDKARSQWKELIFLIIRIDQSLRESHPLSFVNAYHCSKQDENTSLSEKSSRKET